MACPLCGEICGCSAHSPRQTTSPNNPSGRQQGSLPGEGEDSWRQEVTARLHRYRTRRRSLGPRYPSLRLRFDPSEPRGTPAALPGNGTASPHASSTPSITARQAIAVDPVGPADVMAPQLIETGKVIEFPRSSFSPPVPLNELADAVISKPRILEAPEVVPPPPALGGIIIEDVREHLEERHPGIDMPLQSAPSGRRLLAVGVDASIVLLAVLLFGAIALQMTSSPVPRLQLLGLVCGVSALLWAGFQYILIVYSGTTPGLRLSRLHLSRFDGRPADRRLRRLRVLASLLSGACLGLGHVWYFFDEDALCWHDRVTRTYVAPVDPPEGKANTA
jgi:uncharacterized RDD family membrane protein YckC